MKPYTKKAITWMLVWLMLLGVLAEPVAYARPVDANEGTAGGDVQVEPFETDTDRLPLLPGTLPESLPERALESTEKDASSDAEEVSSSPLAPAQSSLEESSLTSTENLHENASSSTITDLSLLPAHVVENKEGYRFLTSGLRIHYHLDPKVQENFSFTITLPDQVALSAYPRKDAMGQAQALTSIQNDQGQILFYVFYQAPNLLLQATKEAADLAASSETGLSGELVLGQALSKADLIRVDGKDWKSLPSDQAQALEKELVTGVSLKPQEKAASERVSFTIQDASGSHSLDRPLPTLPSLAGEADPAKILVSSIHSEIVDKKAEEAKAEALAEKPSPVHPKKAPSFLQKLSAFFFRPDPKEETPAKEASLEKSEATSQGAAPVKNYQTKESGRLSQGLFSENYRADRDFLLALFPGRNWEKTSLRLYTYAHGQQKDLFPGLLNDRLEKTDQGFRLGLGPIEGVSGAIYYELLTEEEELTSRLPSFFAQVKKDDQALPQADTNLPAEAPQAAEDPQAVALSAAEQGEAEKQESEEPREEQALAPHFSYAYAQEWESKPTQDNIASPALLSQNTDKAKGDGDGQAKEATFLAQGERELAKEKREALFQDALSALVLSMPTRQAGPQKAPAGGGNRLTVNDYGTTRDQYPVELEYHSHQGFEFTDKTDTNLDPDKVRVYWDIEIELDPVKQKDLEYTKLFLDLTASNNQGLTDWTVKTSWDKGDLQDAKATSWGDSHQTLQVWSQTIEKSAFSSKQKASYYIRVEAKPQVFHQSYSLGLRLSTDKNYIFQKKQDFLKAYYAIPNRPPWIIKWIRGLDQANSYDQGFNLIETRLVAETAQLQLPTLRSQVYHDKTRSLTGKIKSDKGISWEFSELLRRGDTVDPAAFSRIFNLGQKGNPTQKVSNIVFYVPKAEGGYKDGTTVSNKTLGGLRTALNDAEAGPGTLVFYTYDTTVDSATNENTIQLNLKPKWEDEKGMVGGWAKAMLQKITPNHRFIAYYPFVADYPNKYPNNEDKRIAETGEWAFCFNVDRKMAQSGSLFNQGLTQNDVTGDGILKEYASPGYGRQDGVLERVKKVFYYLNHWEEKFQKDYGQRPNASLTYELYQEVLWHQLRDENDSYHGTIGWRFYQDGPLYDDYRDLSSMPEGDGYLSATDTMQKSGSGKGQYSSTRWIIQKATEICNNIDSDKLSWDENKAGSVHIRLYTHDEPDVQSLITGRVTPPVNFTKWKEEDGKKEKLTGVEFQILTQEGSEVQRWTSVTEPSSIYLQPGNYILREVKAPEGYEKIPDIPFTLVHNEEFHTEKKNLLPGTTDPYWNEYPVKIVEKDDYLVQIDQKDIPLSKDGETTLIRISDLDLLDVRVINVPDKTTVFSFTKLGASGLPLDGAAFQLVSAKKKTVEGEDGSTTQVPVYDRTSTGEEGVFTFQGLREGTYTLTETQTPIGYHENTKAYTLKVTEDKKGELSVSVDQQQELSEWKLENGQYSLENTPITTDLKLRKIDEETGLGLEGGSFELVQTSGGKYQEIAHATNGLDDSKAVNKDPNDPNPDPKKRGFITFRNLSVGSYLLRELAAPNGYAQTTDTWRVEVTPAGEETLEVSVYHQEHTLDGMKETKLDLKDGVYTITNKAESTELAFTKKVQNDKGEWVELSAERLKDEKGSPVQFLLYETNYYGDQLYREDDTNKPVYEVTISPDKDGKFHLTDLRSGSYYKLVEINPPAGYTKPEKTKGWDLKVVPYSTGELKVLVSHPDNLLETTPDNKLLAVRNVKKDTPLGKLEVRKIGDGIKNPDMHVGLRRAHIRLYPLDKEGKRQKKIVNGREVEIYQERVTTAGDNPTNEADEKRGYAYFENLEPGQYELVEHMSPAGYEKEEGLAYIVTVDSKGQVTWHKKTKADTPAEPSALRRLALLRDPDRIQQALSEGAERLDLPAIQKAGSRPVLYASPSVKQEGTIVLTDPVAQEGDGFKVTTSHETSSKDSYTVTVTIENTKEASPQKEVAVLLSVDRTQDFSEGKVLDQKINDFLNKLKDEAKKKNLKVEVGLVAYGLQKVDQYTIDNTYGGYGTDLLLDNSGSPVSPTFVDLKEDTNLNALFQNSPLIEKDKTLGLTSRNTRSAAVDRYGDNRLGALANISYPKGADKKFLVHFSNGKPTQSNKQYTVNSGLSGAKDKKVNVFIIHTPYGGGRNGAGATKTQDYIEASKTAFGDNFFTASYGPNGFKDEDDTKLTTFFGTILQALPQEDSPIQEGEFQVSAKEGFSFAKDSPSVTKEGVKLSWSQDNKTATLSPITLGAGDSLDIKLTLTKDEATTLSATPKDLYSASLTPKKGDKEIPLSSVTIKKEESSEPDQPKPPDPTEEHTDEPIEIVNEAETLARIPLRVTKVNEYGRVMNQAQFRLVKNMDKISEYEKMGGDSYKLPYDAIAAATGLPGDHYFRELTPGEYTLTEEVTPEGYLPPTDDEGKPMHWTLKVVQREVTENGETKKRLFVILPGSKDEDGNTLLPGEKYLTVVPDDHRTKPARPDAPYKGIDEARITNYAIETELRFQKRDALGKTTLAGAKFRLVSEATYKEKDEAGQEKKLPVYDQTVESTTEGVLFEKLEDIGKYTLTEIKAPDGYQLGEVSSWKVEVKMNPKTHKKEAYFLADQEGKFPPNLILPSQVGEGAVTSEPYITNAPSKIDLHFQKIKASRGDQLWGRTFRLEDITQGRKDADRWKTQDLTGTSSNDFVFKDLKEGTYRLSELPGGPNDKFIQPKAWILTVVRDKVTGKLTITWPKSEDPNLEASDDNRIDLLPEEKNKDGSIKNPTRIKNYEKGKFTFVKKSTKGKVLTDAAFSLTKTKTADGKEISYVYDKDNKPTRPYPQEGYYQERGKNRKSYSFEGLTEGTYELEEIEKPSGVSDRARDTWTFKVVQGEKALEVVYLPTNGETAEEAGFLLPKDLKKDEEVTKPEESGQAPKPGEDTKPDYEKLRNDQDYVLLNKVTSTELSFTKMDDGPGWNELEGATFTLTAYDKNPREKDAAILTYPDGDQNGQKMVWTLDGKDDKGNQTANYSVKDLKPGFYLLEETKAPEGYLKPGTDAKKGWVILVNADLTITLPEENEESADPHLLFEGITETGINRLRNFKDLKIQLYKRDGNGKLLTDGTLTLTLKVDSKKPSSSPEESGSSSLQATPVPEELKEITLDLTKQKEGKPLTIPIDFSMQGDYILEEKTPPDGYVRSFDQYVIRVSRSSGKVELVEVRSKSGEKKDYSYVEEKNGNPSPETNTLESPILIYHYKNGSSTPLVLTNTKAEYPQAGGMGPMAYTLSGLAFLLLAGGGLALRRKKEKEGGRLCG